MKKCLGCYQPLKDTTTPSPYHESCSKKLFGTPTPPEVDFGFDDLETLAKKSINKHLGITGVQPKISVNLTKTEPNINSRMMIVDLWGTFILKPPSPRFPAMSAVEDLTMHLAKIAGLKTALHGLIELKSGELAYITKRFDRAKKNRKIGMEDFCQLSELLTESKYSTSTEKAGKIILKFSSQPGLDIITFFELCLFNFLTGNADMHLKNFSLIHDEFGEVVLSPAYDLLSTYLMPIKDREEVALTINGKKSNLRRKDFITLANNLNIPGKVSENSFDRILAQTQDMTNFIKLSFLSSDLKKRYIDLIKARAKSLSR